MSVVFSLKNLFGKKPPDEADPSVTQDLSFGTPDPTTATIEAGSTQNESTIGEDSIARGVDQAELISVPLLGAARRRPTSASCSPAVLSLVVLGSVAIFAVNQADKVAQQVAGTGYSLMQSQRLPSRCRRR
jgi:twitching motility protein PilJ